MKKLLCILLAAALLIVSAPAAFAADTGALAFRQNGAFTVLQLTDTQDDHYPAWDMLNLVRRAVETADPDLIVLTGDLVEDTRVGDAGIDAMPGLEGVAVKDIRGNLDVAKTRANVEAAVDAVFSVLEEYGVPYVIALGNNDRKVGLSAADWLEIFAKYPHCVAFDESPDAAARLDYHVTVKGADGADKFNIWLMDTGLGGISDAQVDWYRETSKAIAEQNGGTPVPALAFQHIQVADIGNLFELCEASDEGARRVDSGWVRLNKNIAGGYNFYGYEPGRTSYEFTAWKECGDVIGAFFGHQHVEGFSGVWQGIELGFTYGCEMAKTGPYGFRVFTLHEDDITHYGNVLYSYAGYVKLGTDTVTPEENKPYETPSNRFLAFFAKIRNLFYSLFSAIVHLF